MKNRAISKRKRMLFSAAAVSIGLICAIFTLAIKGSKGAWIKTIPEGLPEAEVEKWKKKAVDKEQFFLVLNTALTVKAGEQETNLALMNPPYSAYDFEITMVLKDEEYTLLYQSDRIAPGTYEATVLLKKKLSAGSYEAEVHYTFYEEGKDTIVGEHAVPVTIDVND